jgi:hypothetical protein
VLTQSAEGFDIICVQEVGEVSEVPSQQPFPGYGTFVASTGRAQGWGRHPDQKGTGVLCAR